MKHFILALVALLTFGVADAGNNIVFTKTVRKGIFTSQILVDYYHSHAKGGIGFTQFDSHQTQPFPPEYTGGPTEPFPRQYTQLLLVPGLTYDKTLGKHGAYVYSSADVKPTICSYRTFFGEKDIGLCAIEVLAGRTEYTIRLVIR